MQLKRPVRLALGAAERLRSRWIPFRRERGRLEPKT